METRPLPPDLDQDPTVAAFLVDVRAAYTQKPDVALAFEHLASMLAADAERAPASSWQRFRIRAGRLGRRATAVGALKLALTAGVAAAAAGGGLAATGNLPSTVQHDVADMLSQLGIELPDPAADAIDETPAGGAEPPGRGDLPGLGGDIGDSQGGHDIEPPRGEVPADIEGDIDDRARSGRDGDETDARTGRGDRADEPAEGEDPPGGPDTGQERRDGAGSANEPPSDTEGPPSTQQHDGEEQDSGARGSDNASSGHDSGRERPVEDLDDVQTQSGGPDAPVGR